MKTIHVLANKRRVSVLGNKDDMVCAGSTPYRTKAVLELLRCKPTVIRGNAGEIMALAGSAGNMKGVDSTAEVKDAHSAAIQLAKEHFCVVAVSGEVDFVCPPCQPSSSSFSVSFLCYCRTTYCCTSGTCLLGLLGV